MWRIIWDGNTAHVEEHGLTVEDVEIVVYESVDEWTICPVTAYEVAEP